MITVDEPITIIKSDNFQSNDFKIKSSRKAFHILSSQLYTHKIRAVVRETACNAYDAYIEAQKNGDAEQPFSMTVHLPNAYELFFSIRDYGTGLCDDDVQNLYTTYFESTKTNSNDYTGCLGLGSKACFCYTDNFSITSFYQGVKREYVAFIGESGTPQINLLSSEDTVEHDGLEVRCDVKAADIENFKTEAGLIFKEFPKNIEFTGNHISILHRTPLFSGKNWKIFKREYGSKPSAKMGNVRYPIDVTLNTYTDSDLYYFTQNDIEITFDIGEVEISPNRETLSLDEHTVEVIKTRYREVYAELVDVIKDELAKTPYAWDRALIYRDRIKSCMTLPDGVKSQLNVQQDYDVSTLGVNYYDGGKSLSQRVKVEAGNRIFIRDLDTTVIKRLKENSCKGYLVSPEEEQAFRDACGINPNMKFQKVSELSYSKGPYNKSTVIKNAYEFLEDRHHANLSNSWRKLNSIVVDPSVHQTYVFMKNYQIFHNGVTNRPWWLDNILDNLHSLGINVKVYGVKPAFSKKILKENKLENFFDFFARMLKDWVAANDIHYKNYCIIDSDEYSCKDGQLAVIKALSKYTSDVDVYAVASILPDFRDINKFHAAHRLSNYAGLDKINEGGDKKVIDKLVQVVYDKYPMLKLVADVSTVEAHSSDVSHYLNTVVK